uniref:rRNA adenine N(6)-methyltransferase n=1 Tax=Magallana gigas TaxID=29159 RepID=K1Q4P1_MAGGI
MPRISEIVKLYRLSATKKLSQNFLLDMNVCHKFVNCISVTKGSHICEVGPGPGGITRALLESDAEKVHVIEKDKRFLPPLEALRAASGGRLDVHLGDAKYFDMHSLFPPYCARPWQKMTPKVNIVGNLPFNVSLGLLLKWLEQISKKSGPWQLGRVPLTLTFQHEVAERILADVDSEHRCRLSIMSQDLFPPIMSNLVDDFFKISRVDPTKQSFRLSMEEWRELCHAYEQLCLLNPGLIDYNYREPRAKHMLTTSPLVRTSNLNELQ